MTYYEVKYEYLGDLAARQNLKKMANRAEDFRPVFKFARELIRRANAENFAQAGLPVGGWAPLDAEYGSWKSANFPGTPPMIRSGKLFQDLVTLRGAENVVSRNYAQFGTSIEYAKFHQYGTRKMPKRQILFEPAGFAEEVTAYARKYIIDGETISLTFGD